MLGEFNNRTQHRFNDMGLVLWSTVFNDMLDHIVTILVLDKEVCELGQFLKDEFLIFKVDNVILQLLNDFDLRGQWQVFNSTLDNTTTVHLERQLFDLTLHQGQ
ncbi:hypothetical protein WICPIJ_008899 [Wickerhamomyces pijperi]|uniref:Uncharacterized protein n=1 Tax=Wickerhamomyces pijperi TaxID=599730 RepID=A0A9P8PVN4_WICPI|nr:hypothetical protein WICPIJ_008899 [Wickerhamomyces pijperi]